MARPLRIAVLVKQVPRFEAMQLGADGRLVREGLELELNPYCRRAVAQGIELAKSTGGELVVATLGPPPAEDVLREALAGAADAGLDAARAVLVSDPAFAGSDTLATARALAALLGREGPFDLVLAGRNSVDADTGQVAPELAELLDLPFLAGVRHLTLTDDGLEARCEHDDGWVVAGVRLPAVLSCAERLCDPVKMPPEMRALVDPARITTVTAAELGPGPWGLAGSPTAVGDVRVLQGSRVGKKLEGSVAEQVEAAVDVLVARGALDAGADAAAHGVRPLPAPAGTATGGPAVVVIIEPDRAALTAELLGGAADVAAAIGGHVVAAGPRIEADGDALAAAGAARVVTFDLPNVEDDVAGALIPWTQAEQPWAVLAPSTVWGREVASRLAAALGAGLTGDAVELEVSDGRLVAWKPAFGGALVAAITASSPVQMATVRAGVLPARVPRAGVAAYRLEVRKPARRGRVEVAERAREDDVEELAKATVVVGVGKGVPPDAYGELEPLLRVLGAELGATRKVTDAGWQPRARQIGITGRSIAPRLFVSIGASGKFNHMVGVRGAGTVLAINPDPDALVFDSSDVGIVGDWRAAVPMLVHALEARSARGA